MPQQVDDPNRLMVPRWRPFRIAASMGLLDASQPGLAAGPQVAPEEFEKLRVAWERHRSLVHASELVDAALLVRRPEVAEDAAAFLVHKSPNATSREVAAALLLISQPASVVQEPRALLPRERHERIALLKRHLRMYPRDAMSWVDLARDYSVLGQNDPAAKAIRTALALAPDNRFVLRAAARFFLHAKDPEQARAILRKTPRTREDPWLLAAEIVSAQVNGRSSGWVTHARKMIDSWGYSPRHISELAGALGTLEYEHGNRRGVRRMFSRALEEPTENTVAQAGWISRRSGFVDIPDFSDIPRAYEAMAWEALALGRFAEAVSLSWKWLTDEPFATRPAMFGSSVASVAIGDYDEAIRFMKVAEVANPSHPRVKAQLIFCFASKGEIETAEQLLLELPDAIDAQPEIDEPHSWDVLVAADRGLIAYRRGCIEEGRRFYQQAIELATEHKLPEFRAAAMIYLFREERRANPGAEKELYENAAKGIEVFHPILRPVYRALLERAIPEAPGSGPVPAFRAAGPLPHG